jgi:hypothetical protein
MIAFATGDGHVKIWALPSGRQVAALDGSSVNFSADGSSVVLGRAVGGAPLVHDLRTGKETSLAGGAQAITDLATVGDGREVAAAMMGGVKIWDLGAAQMIRVFDCPSGSAASSVTVSNAAPVLAMGCMDGSASMWNVSNGEKLRDLQKSRDGVFNYTLARFSADGRVLAVAVADTISVFDSSTGQQLRRWKLPPSAVPAVLSESSGQMSPPSVRHRVRGDSLQGAI